MAAKRHHRTLSLYAEVAEESADKKKATIDEMNVELLNKCNSPNRGLKPGHQRTLRDKEPGPQSTFQKLHEEFKSKLKMRQNTQQN